MPDRYRRPHSHERVQAIERMQRAWAAEREALATVRRFNAILSAKGYVWFWPKIAAALTAKHHWLIIACEMRHRNRSRPDDEAARSGGIHPRGTARRAVPALQRTRAPTDRCPSPTALNLKTTATATDS